MNPTTQNNSIVETALAIGKRRKWLILLSFTAVFITIVSLVNALPPIYKASTTLLFGQDEISENFVASTAGTELEQRLEVVRRTVNSRGVLQEVIEQFDLYPDLRGSPMESIVGRMRSDITIEQEMLRQPQWGQNATFAVTVSYQAWDPELAAEVTNELARRYRAEAEGMRTRHATRTAAFLREQLEIARERVATHQANVNEFREQHMGELPQQEAMNIARLNRLNDELRHNVERQNQLAMRRDDLLSGIDPRLSGVGLAGTTREFRLERMRRELTDLSGRFTANHPDVMRLTAEIRALEQDLAANPTMQGEEEIEMQRSARNPQDIEAEIRRLQQDETRLHTAIAQLSELVQHTPRVEQQLQSLNNEYETAREEFLELQRRYQDARLAESLELQQNEQVELAEQALPPLSPAAPQHARLMIIAFILAAGVAGALTLIAEQFNKAFYNLEEIRSFTKLPVLASISVIETPADKVRKGVKASVVAALFIVITLIVVKLATDLGTSGGRDIVLMLI